MTAPPRPAGRLRRISEDRWSIELDEPGAPQIGEVFRREDGFGILMHMDDMGLTPLWAVSAGPHATMAAVTGAIATALRMRDKDGAI